VLLDPQGEPGVALAGRVDGLAQLERIERDLQVLAALSVDDAGRLAGRAQLAGRALAGAVADLDRQFTLLIHGVSRFTVGPRRALVSPPGGCHTIGLAAGWADLASVEHQ